VSPREGSSRCVLPPRPPAASSRRVLPPRPPARPSRSIRLRLTLCGGIKPKGDSSYRAHEIARASRRGDISHRHNNDVCRRKPGGDEDCDDRRRRGHLPERTTPSSASLTRTCAATPTCLAKTRLPWSKSRRRSAKSLRQAAPTAVPKLRRAAPAAAPKLPQAAPAAALRSSARPLLTSLAPSSPGPPKSQRAQRSGRSNHQSSARSRVHATLSKAPKRPENDGNRGNEAHILACTLA